MNCCGWENPRVNYEFDVLYLHTTIYYTSIQQWDFIVDIHI